MVEMTTDIVEKAIETVATVTFTLQIDNIGYKKKPIKTDISGIKNRLCESDPVTVDINQLEKQILEGKTITPGILKGGSKAENWEYQQLFCIDIDNEDKNASKGEKKQSLTPLTIEETFKRCDEWEITPALIYETFSSTNEWLKFRVVFVSDTVISNGEKRDHIQSGLQEIFPECDSSCKNRDRLFFGGIHTLYKNEKVTCNFDNIERIGIALAEEKNAHTKAYSKNCSGGTNLNDLKKGFDFFGLLNRSGCSGKKTGKVIFFNPCPICGHKDDFAFYPESKTFYCFGSSGRVGGSIIDFLMHTENLDVKSAVKKFKYDLCGLSEAEEKAKYHKESMIKRAENNGVDIDGKLPYYFYVDEKTNKIRVSCPLLSEYIRKDPDANYLFVRDQATDCIRIYWYEGGYYRLISEQDFKGIIKSYITNYSPLYLKMKDVNEVFCDLSTDRNYISKELLDSDENIVNFQNGLLHLDTMELHPHDKHVLSTIQIPCNWNEKAEDPKVFTKYINEFTNCNDAIKNFLLQFMGIALSNVKGYRMKTSLFMIGAGNTGKSQLKALTEKLLGAGNYAAIDLNELEKRFGTSKLYGKRLAGSSDMSYMSVDELKIFKQVTGGDSIFAEEKCKPSFEFIYNGLLWFCANKLPKFGGDRGDWVYDRIAVIRADNVIPEEKRDKLLLDKMLLERDAIVHLAIMAAKNVVDNGYNFDIPDESKAELKEYKKINSPVATFFDECCVMRDKPIHKGDNCTTKTIHEVFAEWCKENRFFNVGAREFKAEMAQVIGNDDIVKKSSGKKYYIFTLTAEVKEQYHKFDCVASE